MVRMVLELNCSKPYSIPTAMVKNSPGAGSEVYFLSVCAIFQPPFQPVVEYQAVPIHRSLKVLKYRIADEWQSAVGLSRLALTTYVLSISNKTIKRNHTRKLARVFGQCSIPFHEKPNSPLLQYFRKYPNVC